MYYCLDCGALFENLQRYTETHGLNMPPYEKWIGCPQCAGAFIEAQVCDVCGEYIIDDYYTVDDLKVCSNCCEKKTLDGGL